MLDRTFVILPQLEVEGGEKEGLFVGQGELLRKERVIGKLPRVEKIHLKYKFSSEIFLCWSRFK